MSALTTILEGLKSLMPDFAKSDASIEGKIIDVVATYADSEKIERDNSEARINDALSKQVIAGIGFYRAKAAAYQQGDTVIYDPVNFSAKYAVVDETKQIVKQAYIVGSFPQYSLLVNKIGADGHLTVLTPDELSSFKTYFSAFQPLGMEININTLPVAQLFSPNLIIYVKPGIDASVAVDAINTNLLSYERVMRDRNTVSMTEIVNIFEQYDGVTAVSISDIYAEETRLDGTTRTVYPEGSVLQLLNGAFTFATPVTTDSIKILE